MDHPAFLDRFPESGPNSEFDRQFATQLSYEIILSLDLLRSLGNFSIGKGHLVSDLQHPAESLGLKKYGSAFCVAKRIENKNLFPQTLA